MRDTGGGFGQKVLVQRDEMCLMLAAPKVGAPLKWVEDRRENLLAAGKSRVEHGDVRHGVRGRRRDRGRVHRLRPGLRRVSDAVAGHDRGRGRRVLPRAVPRAPRRLHGEDDLHEHRRPRGVPRALAVRDRWRARCCSTSRRARMGIDPVELRRRNLLRARRPAVRAIPTA